MGLLISNFGIENQNCKKKIFFITKILMVFLLVMLFVNSLVEIFDYMFQPELQGYVS